MLRTYLQDLSAKIPNLFVRGQKVLFECKCTETSVYHKNPRNSSFQLSFLS